MLLQVWLDESNFPVNVEAENLNIFALFDLSVELLQVGKLRFSGAAPCGPEINEKRFASQFLQSPALSLHIFQIKPGKLFLCSFPASFAQFLFCSLRALAPDDPSGLCST